VREVAQVTYYDQNDLALGSFTLTTGNPLVDQTSAVWSGPGSVFNLSPAVQLPEAQPGSGSWRVSNPFGNLEIGSLKFEALAGACGTGACNNQSDYLVTNITAVPEPETYALMLAGLAAVGFVARRRRPAA
jgi:PEP-CTERM motif